MDITHDVGGLLVVKEQERVCYEAAVIYRVKGRHALFDCGSNMSGR